MKLRPAAESALRRRPDGALELVMVPVGQHIESPTLGEAEPCRPGDRHGMVA